LDRDRAIEAVACALAVMERIWDYDLPQTADTVKENINIWERLTGYLKDDPHYSNGKHSGDCTNESHSCLRCEVEKLREMAAVIVDKYQDSPAAQDEDPTIEDGFGSGWSKRCPECGELSMEVVRPGKVQCGRCG
jgi:hypothetical protein